MNATSPITAPVLTLVPGPGIVFDADAGTYKLDTAALPSGVGFSITSRDAAGVETTYTLTLAEMLSQPVDPALRFDTAEALAKVAFLGITPPSWTLVDGAARLVPAATARAHGNWTEAAGDGVYRCLFRLGGGMAPAIDRRFTFGARVGFVNGDWTGIRVEPYETSAGAKKLHIREYIGASGTTNSLATIDLDWAYDVWQWLDVEVLGDQVRGRIYAEAATAPEWQISATTAQLAPGVFGPGGFASGGLSPIIDVKELRFTPA